jgi:hypothetical protein
MASFFWFNPENLNFSLKLSVFKSMRGNSHNFDHACLWQNLSWSFHHRKAKNTYRANVGMM